MSLPGGLQKGFGLFVSLFLREGIGGDPIGAFTEDGDPVDFTGHRYAVAVFFRVPFQIPNPDFLTNLPLPDSDNQRIQIGLSVAVRPPSSRILHREGLPADVCSREQLHFFPELPAGKRKEKSFLLAHERRNLNIKCDPDKVRIMFFGTLSSLPEAGRFPCGANLRGLTMRHRLDPKARISRKNGLLVNTLCHKRRPPIPAGMTLRFPDEIEMRNGHIGRPRNRKGLLPGSPQCFALRGPKTNPDPVLSRFQVFLDLCSVFSEVISGLEDFPAVQKNGGKGIHPCPV